MSILDETERSLDRGAAYLDRITATRLAGLPGLPDATENPEAERAVLFGLLKNADLEKNLEVDPEWFADPVRRQLVEKIYSLRPLVPDIALIRDALSDAHSLEYETTFKQNVSTAQFAAWVKALRRKFLERKIDAAHLRCQQAQAAKEPHHVRQAYEESLWRLEQDLDRLKHGREPGSDDDLSGDQKKLRHCDMSTVRTARITAPKFVIAPLIPRGHFTLFGGHGGTGKSILGLVLGAHVACGRNWAGLPVEKGKVLLVSFEDDEELMLWRLKNIIEEYSLDFDEVIKNFVIKDGTAADAIMKEVCKDGVRNVAPTDVGEELTADIRQQRYDLVIVDNASDVFDGDENQRRQVRKFVRYCAATVKPHNGAFVLQAHIDKTAARYGSSGNSYSGSTGWHNSARSRLALVDTELRQEKLNVGRIMEQPIGLYWTDIGVPVPDSWKGAQSATTTQHEIDDETLLLCFAAAASIGETVGDARTGPGNRFQSLSIYAEFPAHLKKKRDEFDEAIARLLRSGKIIREEYKNTARQMKARLVLATPINHAATV